MPDVGPGDSIVDRLRLLGLDEATAQRAVGSASDSELKTLDRALSQRDAGDRKKPTRSRTVDWIAYEYLRPYGSSELSRIDIESDVLTQNASALADTARLLRIVPPSMYPRMWPVVSDDLTTSAHSSYQNINRALSGIGITDALEAENHSAMRDLDVEDVPPIDLDLLRKAGYSDPEWACRHIVRTARSEAASMERTGIALSSILEEGREHLHYAASGVTTAHASSRPKKWAGFSKLLTGAALAGLNIVSGIALATTSGPLAPFAVGAGLPSVLGSAAAGVGQIAEGVGVLRGE